MNVRACLFINTKPESVMISEIINRKVAGKFQNIWRLNNTLLKAHGSGSKNKFEEKNKHVFH